MLPFNNLAFGGTFGPASLKPMAMAAAVPMAMPVQPSPFTKKPNPPAATPLCGTDNLKRTKDVLNEDISKLQSQVCFRILYILPLLPCLAGANKFIELLIG